jgi:hypothetical protein
MSAPVEKRMNLDFAKLADKEIGGLTTDYRAFCARLGRLERSPPKWMPVRRKRPRQNKTLERVFDPF